MTYDEFVKSLDAFMKTESTEDLVTEFDEYCARFENHDLEEYYNDD